MSGESKLPSKKWKLDAEYELRLEVDEDNEVAIKLLSGTAELFGKEIAKWHEHNDQDYIFTNIKFAIFTWHGCEIEVVGRCTISYTATETPMVSYINTHGALQKLRKEAEEKDTPGPRALIVGPTDSGKSTLSKILLNYAVRSGWEPTLIDLDVGQNSIGIPGTLCMSPIEYPIDTNDEFKAPLQFFFGHDSPGKNLQLYKSLVEKVASVLDKRCTEMEKVRHSGVIINTCGWVDGAGYDLLVHAAETLKVDVILVMGTERLYSQLKQDEKVTASVAKLVKSGGVVQRDSSYRRKHRMDKIKQYFYGHRNELSPHQKVVEFKEVYIYRLGGGPQAPSTALPIGSARLVDPNAVRQINPSLDLLHCILAISYASNSSELLEENVAGFIYVQKVDEEARQLTVLSPAPGPLPANLLLSGSIKWFE